MERDVPFLGCKEDGGIPADNGVHVSGDGVQEFFEFRLFSLVGDGIDGQVEFCACVMALVAGVEEFSYGKVLGRSPHIEVFRSDIDGVATSGKGGCKRCSIACGSQQFWRFPMLAL